MADILHNLIKKVSWNATSKDALDKITPVNPPIVNKAKKPKTNNKGVLNFKVPPYNVAQGSAFNHHRFSKLISQLTKN
jgi:hypothetical protein